MLGYVTLILKVRGTAPVLLLIVILVLALGSCGGEGASFDEEETTAAETGAEATTPTSPGNGGTPSAKAGGRGGVPADVISVTLGFIPSGDSGVSGTAILADTSGGLEMRLNMRNLPGQPGAEYLAHIHEGGTCADDRVGNAAPVQYSLEPVIAEQGRTGSSTTAIPDVSVVQLFSGAPKYVDVHAEAMGEEVAPSLACADVYTTTGGD